MVRSELVKRSPLRILDQSIHGGLESGGIGVIASRKGVGKTACLVHLATDQLFQEKHVIHVSFSSRTDHIISWYEDIFREIARKRELEDAMDVHDEIIKNRVVMNFSQEGVSAEQVIKSIRAMIVDGNFKADVIMIDGYDFEKGTVESLKMLKEFVADLGITAWFTATLHREDPTTDENGVPQILHPYVDVFSVLIRLAPTDEHIKLSLVKDHETYPHEDLHLRLDPRTLLIAEDA